MLVKSFISKEELQSCLDWSEKHPSPVVDCLGKSAKLSVFGEKGEVLFKPEHLNVLRKRCIDLIGDSYLEPIQKDFYLEIKPKGFISKHTDTEYPNLKHIKCNLLIQKPEFGGKIIVEDKKISMDAGDMFILRTWIPHEVEEVIGNKSYKSIVFGFLVQEQNTLTKDTT